MSAYETLKPWMQSFRGCVDERGVKAVAAVMVNRPDINPRHISSLLESWGRWIEYHADEIGYPSQAAIAGVIDAKGEFNWFRVRQFTAKGHSDLVFGGHRILCIDMPERIRATNMMVNRLSDEQYDAVLAEYGLGVRDDGLRYTRADKARALGCTVPAFEMRLSRAKERIAEILRTALEIGI